MIKEKWGNDRALTTDIPDVWKPVQNKTPEELILSFPCILWDRYCFGQVA